MIPEFTLIGAIALLLVVGGAAFLINGMRGLFLDEIITGVGLLIIAWWLVT